MHDRWHRVSIVSNVATRELEAWLGHAHLWSTRPTEPGSADEVVEFFTTTLIRLIEVVEAMSAHERINLLAKIAAPTASGGERTGGILGPFPA
ncbi:hypothetical protein [Palleronia sp.]|uniref:hypothetical protein n=1 Tax=Palleronia sp. TaxID=1940284 RepID=UPI0035C7D521